MNLLSRKEVADLIQESQQFVGIKVKRGFLIEKAKRIDTDSKKNKAFLAQFMTNDVVEVKKSKPKKSEIPQNNKSNGDTNTFNLDVQLKEHELILKKIKIKKDRLDLTKKEAKLIELLESKDIMNRAIVVLSSQYRQNSKLYILELAAKYKIPDSDLAGIQKWFDETINKAVSESKSLIKTECKVVSENYSGSLGIGESA